MAWRTEDSNSVFSNLQHLRRPVGPSYPQAIPGHRPSLPPNPGASPTNGGVRRISPIKSFNCSFCGKKFSSQARRLQHEWKNCAAKKNYISNTLRLSLDRSHVTPTASVPAAPGSVMSGRVHTPPSANPSLVLELPATSGEAGGACCGDKLAHERNHSLQKSFSCSFCPKTFSYYHSKLRHERIHTGERPFPCTFCTKTFRESSSKIRHERIHTGERPYTCDFCPKAFVEKMAKVRHERVHRPVRTIDMRH